MSPSPFTSTGAADEATFTVVQPSKQQIHFRQKQAGANAWEDTACRVQREKEIARRWEEGPRLAQTEERIKRSWKKERQAVAAKRAQTEQQIIQDKKRKAEAEERNAPFCGTWKWRKAAW
ncbi:hypothetical protein MMC17_001568 [Xylographa soralifera]|nr:hypothetical protein [Xylographa soralifera]